MNASSAAEGAAFDPDEEHREYSLEDLSRTYQQLIDQATREEQDTQPIASPSTLRDAATTSGDVDEPDDEADAATESTAVAITPESILQAILFVGRSDGRPIAASDLAAAMRGVDPGEIPAIAARLNANLAEYDSVQEVFGDEDGFRLRLRADARAIEKLFLAEPTPQKLSQAAIDALALVAYRPGLPLADLEAFAGRTIGPQLKQLIKRQLVESRQAPADKAPRFWVTERFLDLVGLDSVEDLPALGEVDPKR